MTAIRFSPRQGTVERELKIFSLADFLQALVTHFLQSTLYGLSLRIQNALLQRNVYVSFHGGFLIILQAEREAGCTTGLDQSGKLRVQFCQRAFQDLPVAGVPCRFELLEDVLA